MNKKLFTLLALPLLLTACGGNPTESSTETGNNSESTSESLVGPSRDEVDIAYMQRVKEEALKTVDEIESIEFLTQKDDISNKGTIIYNEDQTLLESTLLVEGDEVDEDGNPVLVPTQNIRYVGIENERAYLINYMESDPAVSNSYAYVIDDTQTGDSYISNEQAKTLLRDSNLFSYDLKWFLDLADDTYIENYQNPYVVVEKGVDSYSIRYHSEYGFDNYNEEFYTYESTYYFDKNDRLLSGTFENKQYKLIDYEQNPDCEPIASFQYGIRLNFEHQDIEFDKNPYFISKINDVKFYSDTSVVDNRVNLNEIVKFKFVDYEGDKALDQSAYYIAASSNEEIIKKDGDKGFRAIAPGKTTLTIKNDYNDVVFSKEVTVVRPALIGFNASASNGKKEITKKVGETDYVEVYFFPEGALPEATAKVDDESVIKITGQRIEVRDNTTYLIFDIQCLKEGVAKVTITPNEAPSSNNVVTYTVVA